MILTHDFSKVSVWPGYHGYHRLPPVTTIQTTTSPAQDGSNRTRMLWLQVCTAGGSGNVVFRILLQNISVWTKVMDQQNQTMNLCVWFFSVFLTQTQPTSEVTGAELSEQVSVGWTKCFSLFVNFLPPPNAPCDAFRCQVTQWIDTARLLQCTQADMTGQD